MRRKEKMEVEEGAGEREGDDVREEIENEEVGQLPVGL